MNPVFLKLRDGLIINLSNIAQVHRVQTDEQAQRIGSGVKVGYVVIDYVTDVSRILPQPLGDKLLNFLDGVSQSLTESKIGDAPAGEPQPEEDAERFASRFSEMTEPLPGDPPAQP